MFKKIIFIHGFWLLNALFLSPFSEAQANQNKDYSRERLQALAEQHIIALAQIKPQQELQVKAIDLDARIGSRHCAQEPELSTASEPPFNRQVTVQLKCPEPALWTQYVHVRIDKLSPIVVANSHIARGQIIAATDVSTELRPQHFVRARYVEAPDLVIGSRSKRTIRQGLPINLNQLCMVCKGDSVTIVAKINGLTIKTSGEALEDGGLGENIRVRNRKSGRLLSAQVTAVETVAVNI
ncbi:flagellar basal body P-ring formation chaperone FlgA [Pseudoalteromonas sp. T1lg75]|uniref:flagellar basal body P-ring formation chaperone FlgA n=1 Tax=Pseudoalteromonas sp. T1lg75 TaxID=2077102 RepID=UPI000CF6D3F5|nr:flagellar basal body P-ring formation chaperone FlgA [Pseudoalteromonas sp. T1lg75]